MDAMRQKAVLQLMEYDPQGATVAGMYSSLRTSTSQCLSTHGGKGYIYIYGKRKGSAPTNYQSALACSVQSVVTSRQLLPSLLQKLKTVKRSTFRSQSSLEVGRLEVEVEVEVIRKM